MPYEPLDPRTFAQEPEESDTMWRYMDIARFLSLLEDSELNFARADQMQDKWEGVYGQYNQQMRPKLYGEEHEEVARGLTALVSANVKSTYLNCWHKSEFESAAMWDIYQRDGRGVAIRVSWAKLTASLIDDRVIHGSLVRYVNYESEFIPESSVYAPFFFKRQSFGHEGEVRLLFKDDVTTPILGHPGQFVQTGFHGPSIRVKVDLKKLIDAVYVAPESPKWIEELIRKLIARYGRDFPVFNSDLGIDPII